MQCAINNETRPHPSNIRNKLVFFGGLLSHMHAGLTWKSLQEDGKRDFPFVNFKVGKFEGCDVFFLLLMCLWESLTELVGCSLPHNEHRVRLLQSSERNPIPSKLESTTTLS
jgi:hypothetical protein